MTNTKKLLPNTIEKFGEKLIFWLPTGEITLGNTSTVIMKPDLEDEVIFITVDNEVDSVSFFKVNGTYRALWFGDSNFCELPEDVIFENILYYEDGIAYIKYSVNQKCGVIRVDSERISIIISHEEGFDDITYEDGVFFAFNSSHNNYWLIDKQGNKNYICREKVRKVEGYSIIWFGNNKISCDVVTKWFYGEISIMNDLLYNKSKTWSDDERLRLEIFVPDNDKIQEVKVLKNIEAKCATILMVKCENNAYYYALNEKKECFELLTSTTPNASVSYEKSCIVISETVDDKCIGVTSIYWDIKNRCYSHKKLQCKSEITCIGYVSDEVGCLYLVDNTILYRRTLNEVSPSFEKIYENDMLDDFKVFSSNEIVDESEEIYKEFNVYIIGFKAGKPISVIKYDSSFKEVAEKDIDNFSQGFDENSFICKIGEYVFVIDTKEEYIPVLTKGERCYTKYLVRKGRKDEKIYIVEKGDDRIQTFSVGYIK